LDYSEKTAEEIDNEIKAILSEQYVYARKLLMDKQNILEHLASALLDKETLDANEIDAIVKGTTGEEQKAEEQKDTDVTPKISP
jgi:cell division protease FtsH